MAELAVGLSKSVVAGAITKVQSVIEEDAKLRQKVKRDLVSITLELEMMQSFLDDTNEEMMQKLKRDVPCPGRQLANQTALPTAGVRNRTPGSAACARQHRLGANQTGPKSNVARTWVKHIRQLAYDVEDFVQNVVPLDDKPIFWRRLLPSCMVQPLPLDQTVQEIEHLKGRVEDINNCYRRYNLINVDAAAGSMPASIMKQQPALGETAYDMLLAEARYAANWHHGAFANLTRLITRTDTRLGVISVLEAGVGTTSIIRKTYNDPKICKRFSCRSWVKPIHPFSPHKFIQDLMAQFYANSCTEQRESIGRHVLIKMNATHEDLEQLVAEKRYLIVLEGLSNMVDWDAVRSFLPDMNNGSRIIVSTQQPEIATLCVGPSYQILELKKFSAQLSVCALFKGAGVHEANQNSNTEILPKKSDAVDSTESHYSLVGRGSEINELRKYLDKAHVNFPRVMSVWGMAGVGKSSLVRHFHYDIMLHSSYKFHKFTWVDVSYPFNLRGFCWSLLSYVDSEKDPIQQCRRLLKKHHCLVVVNDLQSEKEWDMIHAALLPKHSKSVIIVVTTEARVAAYCTNNKELMFNVQGLEDNAAIGLFTKEINKKDKKLPVSHDDSELQELVLKCGGLPEVIIAIADVLARQTRTRMDICSLNQTFMHRLEMDPEFDSLQNSIFRWMHSIILNPPDFLKPCIFYLSIFPRDCYVRRRRLLRRWIAEGYSKESVERHAEENAENFFSELVQLSIFKQVGTTASTRVRSYRVNGFIREYIVSRRMEENLVFELGGGCALTTQSRGRHLVILKSWGRDSIMYESIDFSRLWSLTVFGQWESFFISESMKLLRVLDLEDALGVTDNDLQKMVKLLRHLKFLSLRGCWDICHLPSSLGELGQLQTLDVRHTSIITLPASIIELQKLQYIRAGLTIDVAPAVSSNGWFCRRRRMVGVGVPGGIGKLKGLHTLGVVNVAASGGKAFLKELKKLTQLRKLGVSGINRNSCIEFLYATSGHRHLESLSVRLDKDSRGCLDDMPLPWENIQSLKLYGLGDKLPPSMSHIDKLRKLDLEMDTLEENDIEFLAMLPELCILRLRVGQQLQDGKLCFRSEKCGEQLISFVKVKILEIACSSSRLHVTFGSKSMKNLELLKVDCSSALYQLTGLNYLSELKQVLLKGTNDETIKTDLESQLVNHPRKPAVKLEELPCSS